VDAAARVSPAVVSIRVVTRQRVNVSPIDAWFGVPREQSQQSFGTGFVLREDGIIVTNQHVVAGAEQITVTLADGSDAEGRLLGADPLTDIAVVKVDREDLPVAPVGRSDDLAIGEWAIALGNPYSFLLGNSEPTVTAGVISGTGRNIVPTGNQVGRYYDMIQTDAAINPGNSGGPLVNGLGEVIGVNSSIFSSSGGSVGVGFAIPIERAVRVADEIVRDGTVRRPWLGLNVAGPNRMEEWKSAGGVVVMSVAQGSPADRAGFRNGDVLTAAANRPLRNYLDWEAVLLDLHVGDQLTVTSRRDGRLTDRTLVPGDLPTVTAEKVRILAGLDLVTVTPAIQGERRLTTAFGALVFRVPDAVTREVGLYQGDVIIGIDRTPLRSARDVADAFNAMSPGSQFQLQIERDNRLYSLPLVFR
jgi:serine protease Do